MLVQYNLDYRDLICLDLRLSGLVGDLKIHCRTCAEGVANDLLWVLLQVQ
jgi:hypothetical protein